MNPKHAVPPPATDEDLTSEPLQRDHLAAPRPAKYKYRHKGYRIEILNDKMVWKLKMYYRSESDMKMAFKKLGASYVVADYRMVYPDGAILPKIHDPGHASYWERRRLKE